MVAQLCPRVWEAEVIQVQGMLDLHSKFWLARDILHDRLKTKVAKSIFEVIA